MSNEKPRERRNPIGPTTRTVGANIRRVRGELRWTQADLAARLEENGHTIPVSSIGRIEGGERRIEVDDLMALAVALGTSPVALLLPATRRPEDEVTISGWTPERAVGIWGWALGINDLVWLGYHERDAMTRYFPLWVEQSVRSWAEPEPEDIFHPHDSAGSRIAGIVEAHERFQDQLDEPARGFGTTPERSTRTETRG